MTPGVLPESFLGYKRSTGRPGVRNQLLVLSVSGQTSSSARKLNAVLPGSVLLSSPYGCAQVGRDRLFHDAMLSRLACHPNIGAVVLLAPERATRLRYQEEIEASGRHCAGFSLQEFAQDAQNMLQRASSAGQELARQLAAQQRSPCPSSELALAIECNYSDASQDMVCNPLSGDLADLLVAAGGSVVISETLKWLGTEVGLYIRCDSGKVVNKLARLIHARQQIARDAGQHLDPQSAASHAQSGGISTLEERSHGELARGGSSKIVGALEQGEVIPRAPGLYLMDTPGLSLEALSSMVAAGAQLVVFTSGQGSPWASAIAPTIKLTANPATARRLPAQIDFDASPVFEGNSNRQSVLPALRDLMLAVAEGRLTASERMQEGDEAISRLAPSV